MWILLLKEQLLLPLAQLLEAVLSLENLHSLQNLVNWSHVEPSPEGQAFAASSFVGGFIMYRKSSFPWNSSWWGHMVAFLEGLSSPLAGMWDAELSLDCLYSLQNLVRGGNLETFPEAQESLSTSSVFRDYISCRYPIFLSKFSSLEPCGNFSFRHGFYCHQVIFGGLYFL